ncbi:hypothetical protein Hanom_Chr08g00743561 [Helianthus anomalus]
MKSYQYCDTFRTDSRTLYPSKKHKQKQQVSYHQHSSTCPTPPNLSATPPIHFANH